MKTRLRLLCDKYQRHSSLNLVSQQLKLCNIFIFGMAYCASYCYSMIFQHLRNLCFELTNINSLEYLRIGERTNFKYRHSYQPCLSLFLPKIARDSQLPKPFGLFHQTGFLNVRIISADNSKREIVRKTSN